MRSSAKPASSSARRATSTSSCSWKCPAMIMDMCNPPGFVSTAEHARPAQTVLFANTRRPAPAASMPLTVDRLELRRFLPQRLREPLARVGAEIALELGIQFRMARRQRMRLLEEAFGGDREEFGRAAGAVGVEHVAVAPVAVAPQQFEVARQHRRPAPVALGAAEDGRAVGAARFAVEL